MENSKNTKMVALLGTSGSGKTFASKLHILRRDNKESIIVIDLCREYKTFSEIINGNYISIKPSKKFKLEAIENMGLTLKGIKNKEMALDCINSIFLDEVLYVECNGEIVEFNKFESKEYVKYLLSQNKPIFFNFSSISHLFLGSSFLLILKWIENLFVPNSQYDKNTLIIEEAFWLNSLYSYIEDLTIYAFDKNINIVFIGYLMDFIKACELKLLDNIYFKKISREYEPILSLEKINEINELIGKTGIYNTVEDKIESNLATCGEKEIIEHVWC